jgi:hypothetical protein
MIFERDEDLDRERARRRWNAYLAEIDAEIREEQAQRATFTTDLGKVLEPDIVIKPGSQHANAAVKAGREDEYSNRMKQRYGGEY